MYIGYFLFTLIKAAEVAQTAHYLATAARLELAVSGGSDYHADGAHGACRPGRTSLPRAEYEKLEQRRKRD